MHAVVDVQCYPCDSAEERREEARGRSADVIRVEVLRERCVGARVVDANLDEGLLLALADGACCARLERACRDGVHADAVLAPGLPRERTRVALKSRLGAAHAAAVARNHLRARSTCANIQLRGGQTQLV
eukprot:5230960-Pleurochrysis_carterae.AAC.7